MAGRLGVRGKNHFAGRQRKPESQAEAFALLFAVEHITRDRRKSARQPKIFAAAAKQRTAAPQPFRRIVRDRAVRPIIDD